MAWDFVRGQGNINTLKNYDIIGIDDFEGCKAEYQERRDETSDLILTHMNKNFPHLNITKDEIAEYEVYRHEMTIAFQAEKISGSLLLIPNLTKLCSLYPKIKSNHLLIVLLTSSDSKKVFIFVIKI